MSVPGDADSSGSAPGIRAAAGLFAGFALLAVIDAGAIAIAVPLPVAGVGLRLWHHLFDAAETLGVGAVAATALWLFSSRIGLPWWAGALVYASVATPIQYLALGDDLYRQASVALEGRFEAALFVVYVVLTGLALPAAHLIGTLLSRHPRLRLVPVTMAVGAMIADHCLLRDDYFGLHASVGWTAATLAGASLSPLADRALHALARARRGRLALAALGVFAAFGVAVPPGNAVRFELFRQPCALAPWVLATTVWPAPRPRAPVPPPASPWFRDREGLPPVPPTAPRLLAANPVVVLITVDAVRADAVNDPANDALFPALSAMKRRGVHFTRASAPGSQTAVSLTATFSGRYFSELFWSMHGTGSTRFAYAADDPSPRFPELLAARGVDTATWCSINFITGDFGVGRGFREEKVVSEGRRHAFAQQMIDPLMARLRRAGSEPLFAYAHLMEPHAPYDRGRKDGTDRERYLSEVAVADAQIGRVEQLLEQRFRGRWALIVAADHGEAFGEHQTFQHTKTLYDELVRVPLLVRGPGIGPRTIDERVGLIDLGPTILDLFGIETPATYEGQSLVPILAGGPAALERPMVAEGRLRRAMYTGDGLKVIEDPRRKVVEVYDLTRDPGETRNLFDVEPARSDAALGALQAFFGAHALKRKGYYPPYKP
jgi:hypothetical protein